jgi:anti-sigma-K factor RskA
MAPHKQFLQLCAAATAGELTSDEQRRLDAHLDSCAECRRMMREYEIAAQHGAAALASQFSPEKTEPDRAWSLGKAEKAFLKRLSAETRFPEVVTSNEPETAKRGQQFGYRPSMVQWREVWMSLAAVVLLALALAVTAYRTGQKRGTDIVRTANAPTADSTSLEEQVSDAGHERAQLLAKLAEQDHLIGELRRQLSEQQRSISALKAERPNDENRQTPSGTTADARMRRDQELVAAEAKSQELQKTIDSLNGQRDEITSRAATLEAKVSELTELVRERDQEIDQKQAEVAKQQDLLEHDRDIRELMGARDLYVAEVHDVTSTGQTNKTYGRIFFTKAKRLIFYAYDLDAETGVRNASTFQAWGRRGPDKKQALNLGIFYEDNASKKRWVLKANDPTTLNDVDAVFVTAEPDGGSQHPSGKQLLFAYLRVTPNHP